MTAKEALEFIIDRECCIGPDDAGMVIDNLEKMGFKIVKLRETKRRQFVIEEEAV